MAITTLLGLLLCNGRETAIRKMAAEREEGQALLRSMILSSESEEVDWAAVIAKANELHAKEQSWFRKQNRKERILFQKRQRRALQKRKRFDAVGSFSVNLLTYRMAPIDQECFLDEGDTFSAKERVKSTTSVGSSSLNEDLGSYASGQLSPIGGMHLNRSEENLAPIEEQVEVSFDQCDHQSFPSISL